MQGWIAYLRFVFIYMRSWEIVLSIIMPATLEGLYPVPMKIWPGPMKIWSQSAGSAHLNATSNIKCHPMTNCMCTIRNIKSKCWWPIENEPQRSNLLNSRWQLRGSVTNSFLAFFYHSKADVWEVCPYRLHSMRLPKFQYLGNKSNKNHKTCVIWNPRVYKPGVKIQTRCTKAQLFESIYCHRPNHQPPESHATPPWSPLRYPSTQVSASQAIVKLQAIEIYILSNIVPTRWQI